MLAEIIMLFRGVPQRSWGAHEGEWDKSVKGAREIRGKVIGIVVIDGNITIAREAKDTRGGYFFSWEKSAGMECYEIFEQDEGVRVIGERDAPSEALGERNEGISLGVALVVVYAAG